MITESTERLKAHGIRPSHQRVALYAHLARVRTHPTVDDLFTVLRPTMPTLSRTTVYSTLRLFAERGLAREVRTDDGELRYDGFTHFHAHFKCRRCGGVFDIEIPGAHERLYAKMPKGFVEKAEELTYYGFCPQCAKTVQNNNNNKQQQ